MRWLIVVAVVVSAGCGPTVEDFRGTALKCSTASGAAPDETALLVIEHTSTPRIFVGFGGKGSIATWTTSEADHVDDSGATLSVRGALNFDGVTPEAYEIDAERIGDAIEGTLTQDDGGTSVTCSLYSVALLR
jgi:hypothetical protein